ncbi:MAG: sigma-70 family RNA polymerase sigma factor [Planctomycetaceae bacterium]
MVSAASSSPYLKDPEVQLMLRVKGGDNQAFSQLVDRYQHRIVAILTNLLGGDNSTAEDLAQELFLRIYRARNGYQPTAKFSTWVFRIANNLASNSRRSSSRRKESQLAPVDSGPLGLNPQEKLLAEKSALMPARQLEKGELQKLVQGAMETLNERQRMALLLHKFEGMSYVDIAEAMELSVEAVKSLLSRARDSLRGILEPYVRPGG